MYQKCEDFTGIVLQNDNGAGFRGMLPETQQTCQKVVDSRGVVVQNDKSPEIRRMSVNVA